MLLLILIIAWVASIAWHFTKGHYLLGIFLLLSGLYECSGPILYSGVFGNELIPAQNIFQARATVEVVTSLTGALWLFLLLVNVSYIGLEKAFLSNADRHSEPYRSDSISIYFPLIFFIFVCGLISVYTGAGSVRLLDYDQGDLAATPFFTYGAVLLVAVMIIAIFSVTHRKWGLLLVICVAVSPIVYELLLTSKRQYFAPFVTMVLLSILYSKQLKSKFLLVSFVLIAVAGFFGIQYGVRAEFGEGARASGVFDGTVAPQLGEFVAIGSTTLYAWDGIALGNDFSSMGLHWFFIALNSIPYLKLGDLLFPDYGWNLVETYRTIAPWGGLSMLADAVIGFRFMGVVFCSILAGAVIQYCHVLLQRYLQNGIELTVGGVYAITIIATIVSKYRSGLGDMLSSSIQLTVLYFVVVHAGLLMRDQQVRTDP